VVKRVKHSIILHTILSIVYSQISPGPLAELHTHLEGINNCTQCHELGKKELNSGCLDCHTPLKTLIENKVGYHKDKYDNCEKCHLDHYGFEFNMIFWPDSIHNFNHSEANYELNGKHQKLDCKQCHNQKYIVKDEVINWYKENQSINGLNRSFLGLSQKCFTCHKDYHQKQVSIECQNCHDTQNWKNAIQTYNHDKSEYILDGAHISVECEKCHIPFDNNTQMWNLTMLQYENCLSCHEDIHLSSYGKNCKTCHFTSHWTKELKYFEHDSTMYKLRGKHKNVVCLKCHKENVRGEKLDFKSCSSCHIDVHKKQFSKKLCDECHTVERFSPSTYTIRDHNQSKYNLEGSHIAVKCDECHLTVTADSAKTVQYNFEDQSCIQCHKDIHRNQFTKHESDQCELCHNTNSFSIVEIDHNITSYPLDGKHQNVNCNECHFTIDDAIGSFVQYTGFPYRCVDCHILKELGTK